VLKDLGPLSLCPRRLRLIHFLVFQIPPEAIALVDGERVSEEVVLKQGQVLEFSDEEGDEGRKDDLYKSPEFRK
jgi:hypothetical protein